MSFISEACRRESLLLPVCLDDYVSTDNPLRLLDSFVDSLELKDHSFKFPKDDGKGGRPPYHPKDLLKLLIYGYQHGLRSGRKLEKSCEVNLEVIWLLNKLQPDFKTICDFRRNNKSSFKSVSAQLLRMCSFLKLISGKFIAVDGTVIKASNNPSKNWNNRRLPAALKVI
ncbi:MAG: transposase [Lentisphaerales bacterium]|nr:transposase [Lentisphaerales bacterium]